MQAQDVINRAFRALGVIASGETAGADESVDALSVLNSLFAEWRGQDIAIPDYSVAGLTTALTLDDADKEAVALMLADRIGGEYGMTLSPRDLESMDKAFSALRLRYWEEPDRYSSMPASTSFGYWE